MANISAKLGDLWRQLTWRDVWRGVLWVLVATGFVPLLAGAFFLWSEPEHWQRLLPVVGTMWLIGILALPVFALLIGPPLILIYLLARWFKLSEEGTSLLVMLAIGVPLAIAQFSGAIRGADTRGTWVVWCMLAIVVVFDIWWLIRRRIQKQSLGTTASGGVTLRHQK